MRVRTSRLTRADAASTRAGDRDAFTFSSIISEAKTPRENETRGARPGATSALLESARGLATGLRSCLDAIEEKAGVDDDDDDDATGRGDGGDRSAEPEPDRDPDRGPDRTVTVTGDDASRRKPRGRRRAPTFCGVPVDVPALVAIVAKEGGYDAVTSKQLWRDVARRMRFPEDAMKSHTSLAYHLRTLYARHAGDPAATRAARPPTRDRVIHKNGEVSSVSDEAIAVAAMRELRGIAAERGDDGTAGTRSTPKRQQKRPAAAAASPRASPRASSKRARRDEENARPLVAASRAPSFFFRDVAADADADADADARAAANENVRAIISRCYASLDRLAEATRASTPPPSRPLRPAPPAPNPGCARAMPWPWPWRAAGGIGDRSGAGAGAGGDPPPPLWYAPDPDAYDAMIEAEELRAARGEARLCAYEGTVEWDAPPRPGDYAHQARSIHWFPYDRVGVVNADP